jgi:hypothetical protein
MSQIASEVGKLFLIRILSGRGHKFQEMGSDRQGMLGVNGRIRVGVLVAGEAMATSVTQTTQFRLVSREKQI